MRNGCYVLALEKGDECQSWPCNAEDTVGFPADRRGGRANYETRKGKPELPHFGILRFDSKADAHKWLNGREGQNFEKSHKHILIVDIEESA